MEVNVVVPFDEERVAKIVYNSLVVDPEPRRSVITKKLALNGAELLANFKSEEARTLRVSVNSFFELLTLAVKTVDEFDPKNHQ